MDHWPECPKYQVPCSETERIKCPRSCDACGNPSTKEASVTTTNGHLQIGTTRRLQATQTTKSTETTETTETTKAIKTTKTTETTKATKTTTPSTTVKTTTTKPKPPCTDSSPNCTTWAKNGFCTNTFYPPEKRKEYCGKMCRMC
eukprot:NP_001294422.1 Uncharacterized protein CELE_F49F1.7 [Caenorhabditis elegans]